VYRLLLRIGSLIQSENALPGMLNFTSFHSTARAIFLSPISRTFPPELYNKACEVSRHMRAFPHVDPAGSLNSGPTRLLPGRHGHCSNLECGDLSPLWSAAA
jgi:hypothetical protein